MQICSKQTLYLHNGIFISINELEKIYWLLVIYSLNVMWLYTLLHSTYISHRTEYLTNVRLSSQFISSSKILFTPHQIAEAWRIAFYFYKTKLLFRFSHLLTLHHYLLHAYIWPFTYYPLCIKCSYRIYGKIPSPEPDSYEKNIKIRCCSVIEYCIAYTLHINGNNNKRKGLDVLFWKYKSSFFFCGPLVILYTPTISNIFSIHPRYRLYLSTLTLYSPNK